MEFTGYSGLFFLAFLAATILPLSSEAMLTGMLAGGDFNPWMLVLFASVGNTLGSVVNWALGLWCLHYQDRRWFPVKAQAMEKAQARFRKWGLWSLLLSWVPVIGDPLTLAAGVLKVPFRFFLPLVLVAKTGRYLMVAGLTFGFLN